jgi:hypothetical protein
MPFDSAFDDIYKLGIKDTAKKIGVNAERLDEQMFREGMVDRIYRQIDAADIIIADLSTRNPNVFYELGYAHAKNKLCILLTNTITDIPFDLKHRRHIVYGPSILTLQTELTKNLEWAKTEIENIKKSQIRIASTTTGSLTKTNQYAEAEVGFKIDLFNDSELSSPPISSIYFYTGNEWHIWQDGKECPHIVSDIPEYSFRYMLHPPVPKLEKQSWAHLGFRAVRTIASIFRGDELKDEYHIRATANLRFVTSEGMFDYEVPINADLYDIPF